MQGGRKKSKNCVTYYQDLTSPPTSNNAPLNSSYHCFLLDLDPNCDKIWSSLWIRFTLYPAALIPPSSSLIKWSIHLQPNSSRSLHSDQMTNRYDVMSPTSWRLWICETTVLRIPYLSPWESGPRTGCLLSQSQASGGICN